MTKASELSHSIRTIGGATPTTIPVGALQPRPRSLFMRWPEGPQEALARDGKILANSTTERNLVYNYFRDYDPTLGRYVQSDPIGLTAGVGTYGYVRAEPLTLSDRFGLRDGCGSGRSGTLVPDYPLGYLFFECCNRHDDCYDDCEKQPTKSECDSALKTCLSRACGGYGEVRTLVCGSLAEAYFQAPNNFGQGPFNDARKRCKGCSGGGSAGGSGGGGASGASGQRY